MQPIARKSSPEIQNIPISKTVTRPGMLGPRRLPKKMLIVDFASIEERVLKRATKKIR